MNRLASAPEESISFGSSFVRMRNRVGSRPVQGSRYLRSTVIESSPEMDSNRSTTMLRSVLPDSRASDTIPSGLSISGWSPKFVAIPARVGAATLWRPRMPVSTRAMVPLPLRFGPTIRKIFCWRVSPPITYPKTS